MEIETIDHESEAAPASEGREQSIDGNIATVEELLREFQALNERLIEEDAADEAGMFICGNEDE